MTLPQRPTHLIFDAPLRLAEALDSSTVRWLAQGAKKTGRRSLDLFGRSAALVARGLARITGARFLDSMGELVFDLSELFEGFKERAARVEAALRGSDVAFVMVTSPAPASISEVLFLSDRLAAAELVRGAFVVNRVRMPVLPESESATEEDAARAIARHGLGLKDDGASRVLRAHTDAMLLAAMDRRNLVGLETAWQSAESPSCKFPRETETYRTCELSPICARAHRSPILGTRSKLRPSSAASRPPSTSRRALPFAVSVLGSA